MSRFNRVRFQTVAGYPANHDVGPFCPETTATSAENAGIWFDGNDVYDVDGEFILGLAELYNDANWKQINLDTIIMRTPRQKIASSLVSTV